MLADFRSCVSVPDLSGQAARITRESCFRKLFGTLTMPESTGLFLARLRSRWVDCRSIDTQSALIATINTTICWHCQYHRIIFSHGDSNTNCIGFFATSGCFASASLQGIWAAPLQGRVENTPASCEADFHRVYSGVPWIRRRRPEPSLALSPP